MLGDKIREARKKASLTQEELAAKIGVKRSVISKYENGSISPKIETIKKISEALNVDTVELLDFSNVISPAFEDKVQSTYNLLDKCSDIFKKPFTDGKIALSDDERNQIRELANLIVGINTEMHSAVSDKLDTVCIGLFDSLNLQGKISAISMIEALTHNPNFLLAHNPDLPNLPDLQN